MDKHQLFYIRDMTDLISEYLNYRDLISFHKYLNIPISLKFVEKMCTSYGAIMDCCEDHTNKFNIYKCCYCGIKQCSNCHNISSIKKYHLTYCSHCKEYYCVDCLIKNGKVERHHIRCRCGQPVT